MTRVCVSGEMARLKIEVTHVANYDRFAVITRNSFADFLDRLVVNKTTGSEWEHFIVRHYSDGFLEEIRRCVARLMANDLPIHGNTEAARDVLASWAFLLRSSSNVSAEQST